MIIYLDESKKLSEWKIVIAWFITKHNTSYINKYVKEKKKLYWFKNTQLELKSTRDSWKLFYEKMIKDQNFWIISNNIIWITINWYNKDSKEWYKKSLSILIWHIYDSIKDYNKDIKIIADKLNLWKKTRKVEIEIQDYLNSTFPLDDGYKFNFVNSKSFEWVQISDLICYQIRLATIKKEKVLDEFVWCNSFNMNLKKCIDI